MQVLAVSSEIYPLVKTGGLADVAGALPPALARRGIATRTLIPGYPSVMARLDDAAVRHDALRVLGTPARLIEASIEGLDVVVLAAPELYDRAGGPYADASGRDHADNWRRFAALSAAGAEIAAGALPGFQPDLVHAHDWQAALTPAYLRYRGIMRPSLMTVHNLAFQGQFGAEVFGGLGLPDGALALDGVEYYGGVGFLKAGLASTTAISTVSPTYAREIATPAFGMGLDGLIAARAGVLHGIVNGIDVDVWDPGADLHLVARFSARKLKDRAGNKAAVQARLGLDAGADPLFVVVSRLTWQKGMDLLAAVTGDLVAAGAQLAVLGAGDAGLETRFRQLAAEHRGRVGVVVGYDEPLAHLMQGGGDALLVPSRFEPCGLTQLYALRYGCVPVVARTGGLADTVIDANDAALNAGVATGVQFAPVDAAGLTSAVHRTVGLYRDARHWTAMQRQGMKADVSWDRSAALYADLYASLVSRGHR